MTDFALKIGLALENIASSSHSGFGDLTPIQRSQAASRGAMALGEWPHRVRSEIQSELASRGIGDGAARRELRGGLLAAGRSIRGGSDLKGLMSKAVPEIYVEVGRSFGGLNGPRVLGSVAARNLGISHAELRRLSQAGTFREEGVVDGGYRRALYDADRIDAAAEAWRRSAPIEALMRRLGLPRYACERIVGAGDVEGERHPFALTLEGQPRFRSASVDHYVATVHSACRRGPVPTDAVRLNAAMKMVGGRLKPWRQVLLVVSRGMLPAWRIEGREPLIAGVYVRSTEFEHFVTLDEDEGVKSGAFLSDRLSQIDAVAVLNLRQIDGPRLAAAGELCFEIGSRSLLVRIDEVLAVARDHVATAEAAARFRQGPSATWHRVVRELGPPPSVAGWPRSSFDRRRAGRIGFSL